VIYSLTMHLNSIGVLNMNVRLVIDDAAYTATLTEVSERASLHTGRLLRGDAEVSLPRQVIKDLSSRKTVRAMVSLKEGDTRVVDLRLRSSSYRSGDDLGQCILQLNEAEEPVASMLEFEGLVLAPYAYKETAAKDETALIVEAWVKVDEDQFEAVRGLWATHEYFSVTRRGAEDQPREMRLGNRPGVVKASTSTRSDSFLLKEPTTKPRSHSQRLVSRRRGTYDANWHGCWSTSTHSPRASRSATSSTQRM
jgi:hypothetical protein